MNEQGETKQKITRKHPVSPEEQAKRKKAQKVLKVLTNPKVITIMGFMMGAVNAIKAPFKKVKPPDRALSKYNYVKNARWFYYYAQQQQRDDLVPPPIPEPDKATVSMIKDMVGELGLTSLSPDTNFYHGKVINNEEAKKVLNIQEDINVAPSEKAMPFKVARQMILESQEDFVAAPCLCRNATEDSCVPKDRLSCIYVGKETVDFVAEHSAWSKRITRQEALDILDEAKQDGLVHTIFWNKWVGEGPFCICNCCSCHCGGIDAWNLSAGLIPMFSQTGYVAQVDEDACTGCEKCVPSCHFEAISMDAVKNKAVIDETRCTGCEVCLGICEFGAKSMKKVPDKGEPFFEAVEQAKAG